MDNKQGKLINELMQWLLVKNQVLTTKEQMQWQLVKILVDLTKV